MRLSLGKMEPRFRSLRYFKRQKPGSLWLSYYRQLGQSSIYATGSRMSEQCATFWLAPGFNTLPQVIMFKQGKQTETMPPHYRAEPDAATRANL